MFQVLLPNPALYLFPTCLYNDYIFPTLVKFPHDPKSLLLILLNLWGIILPLLIHHLSTILIEIVNLLFHILKGDIILILAIPHNPVKISLIAVILNISDFQFIADCTEVLFQHSKAIVLSRT